MRLRAAVMVRETALAWERQDQRPWAGGAPGMVRHVDALVAHPGAAARAPAPTGPARAGFKLNMLTKLDNHPRRSQTCSGMQNRQ